LFSFFTKEGSLHGVIVVAMMSSVSTISAEADRAKVGASGGKHNDKTACHQFI